MKKILLTKLTLLGTLFLIYNICFSQEMQENYHFTYFGINFSPIIPSNIIQKHDVTVIKDSITLEVKQKPSYLFGMEVKHDFTRYFALQTGINFIQRRYDVKTTDRDSVISNNLKFISYEIPALGLGFVRVAKDFYADISFGFCMNFYPSDIAVRHYYGQRTLWFQASLLGNLGIEYRNTEYGNFYLGLLYEYHATSMITVFYFRNQIYGKSDAYAPLSGNYLALNLKYYFPQNPNKDKKKNTGKNE
ncbi:MAG: hypothetical protein HY958_13190 [Bacteroidia bacterium]|nr:hypothetical protein [Bacteroidia bacterium]